MPAILPVLRPRCAQLAGAVSHVAAPPGRPFCFSGCSFWHEVSPSVAPYFGDNAIVDSNDNSE